MPESLDIKLKPGGDPALSPLGEIIVNKPLQFGSWKSIQLLIIQFHESGLSPRLTISVWEFCRLTLTGKSLTENISAMVAES